ncbi:MAG: hypothetical protein ABI675_11295 [Chitinophagaceae bacterium]
MKKGIVAIAILLFSAVVHGQQEIKIEDVSKHVGDSVTVCTKIYGGIFLDRSKDTPTLLNVGDKYPNAPLTIVIGPDARQQFKEKPEVFYKDKDVCISGKISLYKDKPQIVVYSEKQIVVK